mgnify:CR=1 FL=1
MSGATDTTGDDEAETSVHDSWVRTAAVWSARLFGHLVGTACIAVLLALPSVDWHTVDVLVAAASDPYFEPAWRSLLIHVGLAACAWALLTIGFHYVRERRRDDERIIRAERGSVMVETLIVIVPFLLLTSGLAQLSLRNVAGILADLAAYQGTRAVWLWQPERTHTRPNANPGPINRQFIRNRARLASAAVLAPTAPSSFRVPNATPNNGLANLRGTMMATFDYNVGLNAGQQAAQNANTVLGGGGNARGNNLNFERAFDTDSLRERAGRKLTFAYLALTNYQINLGSPRQPGNPGRPVSVRFTYQFNIVFPWFAYIFGGSYNPNGPGGRGGWYVSIQRPRPGRGAGNQYRLPRQSEL